MAEKIFITLGCKYICFVASNTEAIDESMNQRSAMQQQNGISGWGGVPLGKGEWGAPLLAPSAANFLRHPVREILPLLPASVPKSCLPQTCVRACLLQLPAPTALASSGS